MSVAVIAPLAIVPTPEIFELSSMATAELAWTVDPPVPLAVSTILSVEPVLPPISQPDDADQEGMPESRVNTCPFDPAAKRARYPLELR